MNNTALKKSNVKISVQLVAALISTALAVGVPQIFHIAGAATGLGGAVGAVLLPMHLPVIAAGLFAGPVAGALAGIFGPIASFALTGMPTSQLLPFMVAELCVYGAVAGALKNVKVNSVVKIVAVQISGRLARAAAVGAAALIFGSKTPLVSVWNAVVEGLPGIALQWVLFPLLIFIVNKVKKYDE